MADSGWGCKSNGANPRWGCKSNFDGAVSPMGRCVHTNWGAQYRGAVSPASEGPSLLRMGKHAGESDEIPDTPTPVVWFTRGVSQYTFCMNDIPMAMGVWLLCL